MFSFARVPVVMVSLRNRKIFSSSSSKHTDGNQAGRLEMLFDGICNSRVDGSWHSAKSHIPNVSQREMLGQAYIAIGTKRTKDSPG